MIRRRKFQAKPNMSVSSSSHHPSKIDLSITQPIIPMAADDNNDEENPSNPFSSTNLPSSESEHIGIRNLSPTTTNNTTDQQCITTSNDGIHKQLHDNSKNATIKSPRVVIISEPEETNDNTSALSLANTSDFQFNNSAESACSSDQKNIRKILKRNDGNLDANTFKMADLVRWNPKTENTLRKKINHRKRSLKESSLSQENNDSDKAIEPHTSAIGPRVRITDVGEMVIDEESLVVHGDKGIESMETVNDELVPKKLNSLSFRKRKRVVKRYWGVTETDLFFEVLAATGTDFTLMHEFIPTRSRAELKRKFNREEKINETRINEVLRKPSFLDDNLKQRAEKILEEINEQSDSSLDSDNN